MRRQRPQQQPGGVFLSHVHSRFRWPWKTAVALITPERAAAGMADDRVRGVPAAVSGKPRAVRQVDVFVDHEEVFVEAVATLEERRANQERGAAGAEHFARAS